MASKYSYSPLSSARNTRILLLEPHARRNAVLRCSIEEVSLDALGDERRQYNALSYVWGAKTGTRPLLCDEKIILITPNCESALRHLRHAKIRACLWIDAIVIDQGNLDERAQQVSLMAEIYRGASEVIIWLGEGTAKTIRFFSRMSILCPIFNSRWFRWSFGHLNPRLATKTLSTLSSSYLRYISITNPGVLTILVGGMSMEDINNLLENDWITRIWTIQEHALASNPIVMCGDSRVTWDLFFALESSLQTQLIWLGPDAVATKTSFDRWSTRQIVASLDKLLTMELTRDGSISTQRKVGILTICTFLSQLGNCSDSRDKVYALYGLLAGKFEQLPSIDYTRSKNELYEDFTRASIQSTERFWLASMYHWRTEPASILPSWVLDLTLSHHVEAGVNALVLTFIGLLESSHADANASCGSKVSLYLLSNSKPGTIALEGTAYTKILASDQMWPKYNAPLYLDISCLYSWISFCVNQKMSENPYDLLGGITFALREILVAGCETTKREAPRSQFHSVLTWFDRFSSAESHPSDDFQFSKSLCDQFRKEENCVSFLDSVSGLVDSILFSTSSGHIGITTGRIERGDIIALLTGSDRPVILRQEGDDWRCIGSSYIHGIMNGEAWPPDTSTNVLDIFVLV